MILVGADENLLSEMGRIGFPLPPFADSPRIPLSPPLKDPNDGEDWYLLPHAFSTGHWDIWDTAVAFLLFFLLASRTERHPQGAGTTVLKAE